MACISGTNVVNDGLVFHFDLENTVKSWKGKPTSNLFAGTNLLNWSGTSSRIADTIVLSETYNGGTIWHLEDADGVNPNVSADNYYMYNSYGPVSTGEVYTFSLDVKVLQKSNIANGGATNAIWIWYAASTEYVYLTNLPLNEWTRVHVTCTVGSTYNYLIPRIDYDSNIIEISNIQFEQGNIATKFTSGIRLDTASIIDISPSKSTITAVNLTYRQDDSPTFDGTNDYIYSEDSNLYSFTDANFTIEAIFKYTNKTGDDNSIVGKRDYGNTQREYNLYVYEPSGFSPKVRFMLSSNLTPNWTIVESAINKNQWYHVVGTAENGVGKIYINGNISNTNNSFHTQTLNGNSPLTIGNAFNFSAPIQYFYGEIPQVKIYNKALTITEIKQNFEAIRSRYNV